MKKIFKFSIMTFYLMFLISISNIAFAEENFNTITDKTNILTQEQIKDINETEGIILRHGEPPIIKRIENENDAKVEGDDVLITCYRSYAHPQEGVLIFKISYKDKSLVYATDKESYPGGDKKLANFARGCNF